MLGLITGVVIVVICEEYVEDSCERLVLLLVLFLFLNAYLLNKISLAVPLTSAQCPI